MGLREFITETQAFRERATMMNTTDPAIHNKRTNVLGWGNGSTGPKSELAGVKRKSSFGQLIVDTFSSPLR